MTLPRSVLLNSMSTPCCGGILDQPVQTGLSFGFRNKRVFVGGQRPAAAVARTTARAKNAVTRRVLKMAPTLEVIPGMRAIKQSKNGFLKAYQVERARRGANYAANAVRNRLGDMITDIERNLPEGSDPDILRNAIEAGDNDRPRSQRIQRVLRDSPQS